MIMYSCVNTTRQSSIVFYRLFNVENGANNLE